MHTSFITVKAPPRRPELSSELQALIEEARRRARRRRFRIAAVLVAAGIASGALYFAIAGGGKGGAGRGGSKRSGATAGVRYTRTKSWSLMTTGGPQYGPYSQREPVEITQAWVRSDGSGLLRTTRLPAEWPGPRDRARALAYHDRLALKLIHATPHSKSRRLSSSAAFNEALNGGSYPVGDALSPDVGELREELGVFAPFHGWRKSEQLFQVGSAVLGEPSTPKAVRAGTFKVLRQMPGVVVNRSARDPLGRAATSAALTAGESGAKTTQTIYFDPTASLQLAYTNKLVRPEKFVDSRLLHEMLLMQAKTVSSIP